MPKDLIVKVTADAKGYRKEMEDARKSHEKFQRQVQSSDSVMKAATSAITKYVSAAALIKGAQEVITRTIQGSQTTADKFSETMAACRTTVNNFFSSLSTGDFTSFNMGLKSIIDNAKEAQAALDRLGNANISWSYFQSARTADFRDQMTIAKNSALPMEQRQAAYTEMGNILNEMTGMVEGYTERAVETMAKEMTKATGIAWQNVSKSDLEKILRLDLMSINASDAEKERLAAQYAEYQQRAQKIKMDNSTYIKPVIGMNGVVIQGGYTQTDEQRAKIAQETQKLAASYQDAILYNEVLVRQSDEWLKNLISLVQQADAARRSMGELNNTYRETGNVLNKSAELPVVDVADPVTLNSYPANWKMEMPTMSEALSFVGPTIKEHLDNLDIEIPDDLLSGLNKDIDTLTNKESAIVELSNAFSQLGAAMGGAGGDALSAAGAILQAVATAAPAYATLTSSASAAAGAEAVAETPTLAGKVAAAATITATLISLVSTLKSVGSYAEGGIVPGRNFTDGITARVSSGEMIINEADQKRLYDSIHSGSFGGGGGGNSIITGEQLVTVINNYGRRTGRGEILR